MHTTGTSELQAQNERLMSENVKSRVDLDLFRQSEILQAKRSRHQSHVIKFNDNKVLLSSPSYSCRCPGSDIRLSHQSRLM